MIDNKQFQHVQETTGDMAHALRETSQTVANTILALQDANLMVTQSLFLNWLEVLMHQTQRQYEAFQQLASASTQLYLDFLFAPFASSQQTTEEAEPELLVERELLW